MEFIEQITAYGDTLKYVIEDGSLAIFLNDYRIDIYMEDLPIVIAELQEILKHYERKNG